MGRVWILRVLLQYWACHVALSLFKKAQGTDGCEGLPTFLGEAQLSIGNRTWWVSVTVTFCRQWWWHRDSPVETSSAFNTKKNGEFFFVVFVGFNVTRLWMIIRHDLIVKVTVMMINWNSWGGCFFLPIYRTTKCHGFLEKLLSYVREIPLGVESFGA